MWNDQSFRTGFVRQHVSRFHFYIPCSYSLLRALYICKFQNYVDRRSHIYMINYCDWRNGNQNEFSVFREFKSCIYWKGKKSGQVQLSSHVLKIFFNNKPITIRKESAYLWGIHSKSRKPSKWNVRGNAVPVYKFCQWLIRIFEVEHIILVKGATSNFKGKL